MRILAASIQTRRRNCPCLGEDARTGETSRSKGRWGSRAILAEARPAPPLPRHTRNRTSSPPTPSPPMPRVGRKAGDPRPQLLAVRKHLLTCQTCDRVHPSTLSPLLVCPSHATAKGPLPAPRTFPRREARPAARLRSTACTTRRAEATSSLRTAPLDACSIKSRALKHRAARPDLGAPMALPSCGRRVRVINTPDNQAEGARGTHSHGTLARAPSPQAVRGAELRPRARHGRSERPRARRPCPTCFACGPRAARHRARNACQAKAASTLPRSRGSSAPPMRNRAAIPDSRAAPTATARNVPKRFYSAASPHPTEQHRTPARALWPTAQPLGICLPNCSVPPTFLPRTVGPRPSASKVSASVPSPPLRDNLRRTTRDGPRRTAGWPSREPGPLSAAGAPGF